MGPDLATTTSCVNKTRNLGRKQFGRAPFAGWAGPLTKLLKVSAIASCPVNAWPHFLNGLAQNPAEFLSSAPPSRELDRAVIEEQKLNLTRVSDSGGVRSALNPQINRLSQNGLTVLACPKH